MQKGGVAQGSRRKNGSLNIQKQGRTWSDEIASNWWGGRAVVDCLFSCAVVIRTACKLICCSYRNKTNLNKNALLFSAAASVSERGCCKHTSMLLCCVTER